MKSVVETNKVRYVFLLAIPENDEGSTQMQLLAEMMTKMSNETYTNRLFASQTTAEFYQNLDFNPNADEIKTFDKSIVAVTACAAGVSQTKGY